MSKRNIKLWKVLTGLLRKFNILWLPSKTLLPVLTFLGNVWKNVTLNADAHDIGKRHRHDLHVMSYDIRNCHSINFH
jgi:hypothetical protein